VCTTTYPLSTTVLTVVDFLFSCSGHDQSAPASLSPTVMRGAVTETGGRRMGTKRQTPGGAKRSSTLCHGSTTSHVHRRTRTSTIRCTRQKGIYDHHVHLSLATAIQFYSLKDCLRYDKARKDPEAYGDGVFGGSRMGGSHSGGPSFYEGK
jgi:hypothetical protein